MMHISREDLFFSLQDHLGMLSYIIQVLGHCITTWYAMSRSLLKQTEIGTRWGMVRQIPNIELYAIHVTRHCL